MQYINIIHVAALCRCADWFDSNQITNSEEIIEALDMM